MSLKRILAGFATALLFAPPVVVATVVIQPKLITANTFEPFSSADDTRLIDQTGLKPGYKDGDPYAAYILLSPVHDTMGFDNAFRTADDNGYIDFFLGGTYSLTNFALWNGIAGFGIGAFELLVSLDKSFSSPVNVGSVSAEAASTRPMQSFLFDKTPGAYVRLNVTESFGKLGNVLGEVAFGGTMVAIPEPTSAALLGNVLGEVAFGGTTVSIPEPTSAALLGLGLAGVGFRRRRLR